MKQMLDYKIVDGLVYDGSGGSPQASDVGIVGDRVAVVGDLSTADARRTVSAEKCIVTPGFIDAHSHSDAYLLIEPTAPSKIWQGITTEIIGNCGCSGAPRHGAARMPVDWQGFSYPGTWQDMREFRTLLEKTVPGVNVGMLIGHNNLRASVTGYEPRAASHIELERMQSLLSESLAAGGIGLSTGLLYPPGRYSAPDELSELLKIVRRYDGIYTTHMRSEGAQLLESLEETIQAAAAVGCRLQISHLKTSGPGNWHKLDALLAAIDAARSRAVNLASDRYPYTAACTELDVLLPEWAGSGERDEIMARLSSPEQRARIAAEIDAERGAEYWERVLVGSTRHADNARFKGQSICNVARSLAVEPVEAMLTLIEKDELHTGGIFFGMSEENMLRILAQPYVMIGTDASLRAVSGPLSQDHPHPRAYGAFSRFLRMARDGETVSVQEAIRKMTSLPAEHFRLRGRGLLRREHHADIAVIDLDRVADKATYAEPHAYSEGVRHLFVNGTPAIDDGCQTLARKGMVC